MLAHLVYIDHSKLFITLPFLSAYQKPFFISAYDNKMTKPAKCINMTLNLKHQKDIDLFKTFFRLFPAIRMIGTRSVQKSKSPKHLHPFIFQKGFIMIFKKFFKRKYPYGPIAFLGRKTVERSLGADIKKLKKVEKELEAEAEAEAEEQKQS